MRVNKDINILGVEEEKSVLFQHYLDKTGADIAITSISPMNAYFDLTKDSKPLEYRFFDYVLTISLIYPHRLGYPERDKFCFLRESGFLNEDYTKSESFDEKLEALYKNEVFNIKTLIRKLMLPSENKTIGYSDTEQVECAKFLRDNYLTEDGKQNFLSYLKEKIDAIMNLSVLNISNKSLYLLEITPTMDEIIKTSSLYKIEEYTLVDRSMGANGEHLTFKNDNNDENVVISNGYYKNGRHVFMEDHKQLFFDEENANEVGLSNVKKIKEVIAKYEPVKF